MNWDRAHRRQTGSVQLQKVRAEFKVTCVIQSVMTRFFS